MITIKRKSARGAGAARKARCDGVATREAIVAAAEEEFAAKGYALASARAICRRAGANAALLARYFGSKDALYRTVAKRLFGDLGAPLAALPEKASGRGEWRRAVRAWVDGMLFMTLPTERPQRLCAALFRHEVSSPTRFHGEFREAFGRPVYEALGRLIAMRFSDPEERTLWASSVWAQVSVYALADSRWHGDFRPDGAGTREWADRVAAHICSTLFAAASRRNAGKERRY